MMSKRLKSEISAENIQNIQLAHFGEDKFAILLEETSETNKAIALVQKIQQCLASAFIVGQRKIFLTFNMGIVVCDANYLDPEEIFGDADLAIQKAKKFSSNYYQVFNGTIQNTTLEILEIETDLRIALQRKEFYLKYQPIICLNTGKISGFETLVRWHYPKKGFISPDKFIFRSPNRLI
jgi:predicted signal transduction protein with EAL and GGDEF domain